MEKGKRLWSEVRGLLCQPIYATLLLIITSHIDVTAFDCYLGSAEHTVGNRRWTQS